MVARIHAVLLRENDSEGFAIKSSIGQDSRLPRDEVVAVPDSSQEVKIAGLAAALSNGHYTYDVQPLDRAYPPRFHLPVEKSAPYITVALPSFGIFVLTISDELNTPRIDLFVAAVRPAQAASVTKSFNQAKALMKGWNREGQGWPIHDFLRAYLESLILGVTPSGTQATASCAVRFGRYPNDPAWKSASKIGSRMSFTPLDHSITDCGNPKDADFLAPVLWNLLLPCLHGPIRVGN
jgi:hypothetical protein